jgi:hypothetical protein
VEVDSALTTRVLDHSDCKQLLEHRRRRNPAVECGHEKSLERFYYLVSEVKFEVRTRTFDEETDQEQDQNDQ